MSTRPRPLHQLRERFTFVPGQYKPHPIRNGSIFLVLLAFVLWIGYRKDVPLLNEGGQEVKAHVETTNGIIPRSDVRVHGVTVGAVKKVQRDPNGGGIITMKIKDSAVTVKKDARVHVAWRTLLGGNFFIDLDPGSPSAQRMPDGGTVPEDRTTSQVEFDQLLSAFDTQGRQGIQRFFSQFDKGFAEAGHPGRFIETLAPTMGPIATAMSATRGTKKGQDIPNLVQGASRTLGALARNEDDLAGLIDHGDTTFAVTAARKQDIGSMLQQAPATLADTQSTMTRLRTTLDRLDPISDGLRPGLRDLDNTIDTARPTLHALAAFLPAARPTLNDLGPAMSSLHAAAIRGVPLLQRLSPTLQRMITQINPWLDKRDNETNLKNAWAIGPFFSHIGGSSGPYDVNGHVQNFLTAPNPLGDAISATDCSRYGAFAANCKLLTQTLGKLLFAGPTAGSVDDVGGGGR